MILWVSPTVLDNRHNISISSIFLHSFINSIQLLPKWPGRQPIAVYNPPELTEGRSSSAQQRQLRQMRYGGPLPVCTQMNKNRLLMSLQFSPNFPQLLQINLPKRRTHDWGMRPYQLWRSRPLFWPTERDLLNSKHQHAQNGTFTGKQMLLRKASQLLQATMNAKNRKPSEQSIGQEYCRC